MFEFCWLWIFPWIKLSWHSCSMWDKAGWLKWFWPFLCERLSSFNPEGLQYSYAWSHSLCERGTSFCKGSISRKLCRFLGFQLALFHSVFYFFHLYQSPSSSLCMFFDSISLNINEVLSINPSVNVLVSGDFNIHHKDWLTYSGGTERSGELCYNFSVSNDITQMVNFPTWIPDCHSHSPAFFEFISFFWH